MGGSRSGQEEDAEERIARVEAVLRNLSYRLEILEQRMSAPPTQRVEAPSAEPPMPSSSRPAAPAWTPYASEAPSPPPPRSAGDLERSLGSNWLAKAGMAVLILGVVFFFKYAFDQGWISRPLRVVLGVVGGLLLAALGDFLLQRRRYGVYPQVLTGGGFVICALAIYTAYAFPDYRAELHMGQELDAALLGLVALALAAYAVWRNTPVLLTVAAGMGNLAALASHAWEPFAVVFVVVLAAAAFSAAALRAWRYVVSVVLASSFGTLFILQFLIRDDVLLLSGTTALVVLSLGFCAWRNWAPESYAPWPAGGLLFALRIGLESEPLLVSSIAVGLSLLALCAGAVRKWPYHMTVTLLVACLVAALGAALAPQPLFFLIHAGALLVACNLAAVTVRKESTALPFSNTVLSLLAILLPTFLALVVFTLADRVDWIGPVTAVVACAALGLAFLRLAEAGTRLGWGVAGLALTVAWPPLQFDGDATPIAWSILALVACAIAWLRPHPLVRLPLYAFSLLAALHVLVFELPSLLGDTLSELKGALVFGLVTLALVGGWLTEWRGRRATDVEPRVLLVVGLALPALYNLAILEGWGVSIAWSVEAVLLVALGFGFQLRDLRFASLGLFGLVLGRVFLVDIATLTLGVRIITFLGVGALLLLGSYLFARKIGPRATTSSGPPKST